MRPIRHGTITGYYGQKCHCDECKRAARDYYHAYAATEPRKPCQRAGCPKKARPRGRYCSGHLKRRSGVVKMVELRASGNDVGYDAAHKRLLRSRGPARQFDCAMGCGRIAHQWSYVHGSPGERPPGLKGNGRPHGAFSLDPQHYRPMCASCHKLYDLGKLVV